MREMFLPGHPENTPQNVGTWTQVQRATWQSLLEATTAYQRGHESRFGAVVSKSFQIRGDSYLIRQVELTQGPLSVLIIERRNGSNLAARIAYRVNPKTGEPFNDQAIEATHETLGQHYHATEAVEIGRLEQIRFQQGKATYDRILGQIKAERERKKLERELNPESPVGQK